MSQEYKLRHTVFIRAAGTAAGQFTYRIDVPFNPRYCIVRQVAYSEDHGVGLIRAPFIQGGILAVFNGNSITSPQSIITTPNPINGEYDFQVVNVAGAAVDMTAAAVGNLTIILEFVA